MPLSALTRDEFYNRLYKVVRPSQPIDASEFLFGRDRQYEAMRAALYAPGRHSFIFGNRGVGKSSLAHSIAFDLQEQAEPILLSCDESTTMESIVTDALREAGMSGVNKSEWTILTLKILQYLIHPRQYLHLNIYKKFTLINHLS